MDEQSGVEHRPDRDASAVGRLRSLLPDGSPFAPTAFASALPIVVAGLVLGGAVLPGPGRYVGLALGAAVATVAIGRAGIVEIALAGASAGAFSILANYAVTEYTTVELPVAATGIGSGLLLAVIGAYVGRRLRSTTDEP